MKEHKGIKKRLLALLMAVTMVVGLIPGFSVIGAVTASAGSVGTKIADPDTLTKYIDSLGDEVSTEYSGRIWTDKSVFANDALIALKTGLTQRIENDADFLVAFSALATSQSIYGQSHAPVDVVFVIDTSGSMNDPVSSTDSTKRIVSTISALNESIDSIMKMNEYTRVAVVAFASTSTTLLPLGRYEKGTYTTQSGGPGGQGGQGGQTITDYFSLSGTTIRIHSKIEGSDRTVTGTRSVTGGTNIQRGLYEGMNILATTQDTTANVKGSEITRVPSVVLLSDGAPTFSSNTSDWWAPANNSNDGDGSSPYVGNGMKALMTAAYMKKAIDRNYEIENSSFHTTLYSVGVGIGALSNYRRFGNYSFYTGEQDLAYLTLNPKANWDNTNSMAESLRNAWTTYTTNNGTPSVNVADNDSFRFGHPASYDIAGNTDALKNVVDSYYDADSSDSIITMFEAIVANIALSVPAVPTEMKHPDALDTGFITYIDPIGEYMELKNIKGIIYDGKYYPADVDGKVSGEVETELFDTQNLSSIKITTTGTAGVDQKIKIEIPAALIPLRINTIELNEDGTVKSHVNNGSFPVRVIYSVGLVEQVGGQDLIVGTGADAHVNTELLSEEYLKKHLDPLTGKINFYSNLYTDTIREVNHEHSVGNATAEFEPSHTNPFYYMQGDIPIYKDKACTQQLTAAEGLDDNTTYYYYTEYYHGVTIETKAIGRTGAQLSRTEIITGNDGFLYRDSGSPRLNRIMEFAGQKSENLTGTAHDFYLPTFKHADNDPDPAAGKYVIYLGNNGKLSVPGTAALEITKKVETPEGLTPSTTDFEFTVDFNGSATLAGQFSYTIVGTQQTGAVADGGTIVLKNGQTARIVGLPHGTVYTVTEKDYTGVGFATTSNGTSGTLTAGNTSTADFTNSYSVDEVQVPPTASGLSGKKIFTGRDWINGTDEYTFFLSPYNNAPLPAGYDPATGVKVTAATKINGTTYEAPFNFGNITFNAPGTYRYTVYEGEPEASDMLPGVTYSRALYRIVVTVTDNGDGTLGAVTDIQKLYTDSAEQLFTYGSNNEIVMNSGEEAQDEIVFTNTYNAASVVRVPVALKNYTDKSGNKPLVSHMFTFKLEALGYSVGEYDPSSFVATTAIPMPNSAVNGYVTTTNEGHNVTFPAVTFTHDALNNNSKITYRYKMTEVAGSENGMTYDGSEYFANVTVSTDGSSTLSVKVAYFLGNREVTNPVFTNEYDPDDAKATLSGEKTLVGRDMTANDSFSFKVEAGNALAGEIDIGNTTVNATIRNKVAYFSFDEMVFTKVGTYLFNITEVRGNAGGMTYDKHVTVATVTVSDVGGQLTATVSYDNKNVSTDTDKAVFVNTYEADDVKLDVTLTGKKNLTGKALVPGEFFFNIFDVKADSNNLVGHADDTNNDGSADIVFLDDVVYTEAGIYEYIITEQIPQTPVKGNKYDTSKYRYTVRVYDDGNGALVIDQASKKLEKWNETASAWETASTIVFNNEYIPDPLHVTIPVVNKVISGDRPEALKKDEFTFELSIVSASDPDGIVLPAVTKVTNASDGTVRFDDVVFKKSGLYVIKVKELTPADNEKVPGIIYSTQEIVATLRVVDDRNGNLSVLVLNVDGSNVITNEYDPDDAKATLSGEKTLVGRDMTANDSFSFKVEAGNALAGEIDIGNTTVNATIRNKVAYFSFDEMVFTKVGTYLFNITEVQGNAGGMTYDNHTTVATVTVTDIGGKLTATVSYDNKNVSTDTDKAVFVNTYEADDVKLDVTLKGTKNLTGKKLVPGEFFFNIFDVKANSNNQVGHAEDSDNDGSAEIVLLDNVNYTEAGTYEYIITEQIPQTPVKGNKYDTAKYRYTVRVYDDGNGALVIDQTSKKLEKWNETASAWETATAVVFNNEYTPDSKELALPVVNKVISGDRPEDLKKDEFTFELSIVSASDPDGIVLPAITKVTNASDGTVKFDNVTFKKAGTYVLKVKELIPAENERVPGITYSTQEIKFTVTVTDDGKGNLTVTPTVANATITNTYATKPTKIDGKTSLSINKVLNGRENNAWIDADKYGFKLEGADLYTKTAIAAGEIVLPSNANELIITSANKADASFGDIIFKKATEDGKSYKFVITELSGEGYTVENVTNDPDADRTFEVKVTDDSKGNLTAQIFNAEELKFVNTYKLPDTPQTGDTVRATVWIALMAASVTGIIVTLLPKKKEQR